MTLTIQYLGLFLNPLNLEQQKNSPTLIAFHESFSVMFLIESVGFWDKVGEA